MESNKRISKQRILETVLSLVYLIVMIYLLSGCGSSHSIPSEGCCSHSEVTITPIKDTEVKRDGVLVYPYQ
jgi:uncharacterized protein YceK